MIKSRSKSAFGAVYEISKTQKLVLDEYETGYDTISFSISKVGECITYIARPSQLANNIQPFDWYKYLVLAGARQHGFPKHYIMTIEKVTARPDPDLDRVRRIQEIFT